MSKPKISIIAALGAKNRAIGRAGGLIWKIEGDLPRFKKLTMGHPIIMGRKTHESIGRALPGRLNIVVTRNPDFTTLSCLAAKSLDEAVEIAGRSKVSEEIFIIGGGEIYAQAIDLVDRLYLTLVESDEPGDIFFPNYSHFSKIIEQQYFPESAPPYTFVILERQQVH